MKKEIKTCAQCKYNFSCSSLGWQSVKDNCTWPEALKQRKDVAGWRTPNDWEKIVIIGKTRMSGYTQKSVVQIEIKISKQEVCFPHLDTDLRPCPVGSKLSMMGAIWTPRKSDHLFGGQCVEEIRKLMLAGEIVYAGTMNEKKLEELLDIWAEWHNNALQSGTTIQTAALHAQRGYVGGKWYEWACKVLEKQDLLIDRGYKFGSSWLFKRIPESVLQRLIMIGETQ